MIHCPNCNNLINKNSNFCPYCGTLLRQSIPPRRPKHHHHIFRNIIVIILLFMIGAGGAYLHRNNMNNNSNGQQDNTNRIHTTNTNTIANRRKNAQKQKRPQNRMIISKSHKMPKKAIMYHINRREYTLSEFPNNIRGTWYTYDQGKLLVITITSNNIVSNGDSNPLHARPINARHFSKHPNWLICLPPKKIRGINLFQTLGWNQTAGDGESFGLINYKGMPVLEEDGGAESWVDNNFFKSKSQAQQNKKKKLPHEIKRPSM